jgi:hypothetical protein
MKGIGEILNSGELQSYNELPDDQREWYLGVIGKLKQYKDFLLAHVTGKSKAVPHALYAGSKTMDLASVMPSDDNAGAGRPWEQPEAGRPWERRL